MALEQEQLDAMDRERARCQALVDRLNSLRGNEEAAQAVRDAWEPLLPQAVPWPSCRLPYYAPELLP